jgi:hypothetical protein
MYKLCSPMLGEVRSIIRVEDGACIPVNPNNTDYQEYLHWLEAGNTPLPADEVTQ